MENIRKYKLAASIICADIGNLEEQIQLLEQAHIDYIHFDVMDGRFVPRFGLYPEMLEKIKSLSSVPVDVHLMIDSPEQYIDIFAKAGADYIVVHAESTRHLHYVIKKIKDLGVKAGVALNPATTLDVLDFVMDDIDLVMLMAINPGIVGHKLIPQMIDKIDLLKKKLHDRPDMIIEIDGGVNPESASQMIKKGANMLVCGTQTIFKSNENVSEKIVELRKNLDMALGEH